MIRLFALLGLLVVSLTPAVNAAEADEAAIHEVIVRQLDAIKKQDGGAAFAIASPKIQAMFGDAATFLSMVKRGYPQIYASIGHRFLNIDASDGRLHQRVLIESEKGSVIVRYEMIEIDGVWRINGCMIEKVEEV